MAVFNRLGVLLIWLLSFCNLNAQSTFRLVWSDEFNGSGAPDATKWGNEIGYIRNNELQYYTNSTNNAVQNQGNLEITVRKEPINGFNYSSASLITKGKTQLAYGKIEAKLILPKGQGLWAAFWTLGANYDQVFWPKCGEIDILEHINNEDFIHATIHWANAAGTHVASGFQSATIDVTQWHTYSVEWTATAIKWFVDGVQIRSYTITDGINNTFAFHLPHYILLNLPIGGDWPGAPNATTVLPATMYCDYVRVYELVPDTPPIITYLGVEPATLTTPVGLGVQASSTIIPYNAANKTLTWQSSNTSVATVNASGLVTGVAVGTATISATTTDGSNKTASTVVTVTNNPNFNYILNPSFELNNAEVQTPLNWSEWSPRTPSSVGNAKVVTGTAHLGSYYASMSGTTSYAVMTFQTIRNLPVGLYNLKGWFRSSGGQPYSIMSIKNHGGNEITKSLTTPMSNWTQLAINNISITTGTCEIDIYGDAQANQWIDYDNLELKVVATTLPIELQSIHAKMNGASNLISWITASEKDNALFSIERSNDGTHFTSIGSLKGSGTTNTERSYNFSDETPLSISYYRLHQTDFNGETTVSKIVSVSRDKGATARFYPSVTKGDVTIELPNEAPANICISNIIGQTVVTKIGLIGTSRLDISHLSAGTYFLTIIQTGVSDTYKLIKQ
jgi:beta-glucanase (GH16 family)